MSEQPNVAALHALSAGPTAPVPPPAPEGVLSAFQTASAHADAAKWAPQSAGEILYGHFLGVEDRTGFHGAYRVLVVQALDNSTWELSCSTVISNWLITAKPVTGDEVAFRFDGSRTGMAKQTYRAFSCSVRRPGCSDWEKS